MLFTLKNAVTVASVTPTSLSRDSNWRKQTLSFVHLQSVYSGSTQSVKLSVSCVIKEAIQSRRALLSFIVYSLKQRPHIMHTGLLMTVTMKFRRE